MVRRLTKKKKSFRQGIFTPKHPDKYKGNVKNINYRSSWELAFCKYLDNNVNVVAWASEEISIPYMKPTTKRMHKYYPDFYVEYKDPNGDIRKELIEIKPSNQTHKSTARSRQTALYENITFAINKAKWEYAAQFAHKRGWKFRILTEKQLFR